jgi:hypothetical protein
MTLAPARTNGTESTPTRQAATDPRHAAKLLRRELGQIEGGDVVGARDVLEALLGLVDGEL